MAMQLLWKGITDYIEVDVEEARQRMGELVPEVGGAMFEALMFGGDCVMLGSAFAGTEESPGEVVHKSVLLPESQKTVKVPFKVLRGMASIEAIRDRLDVEEADTRELEAIGAEGMEISVPARGSARTIVRDMMKRIDVAGGVLELEAPPGLLEL